jgi:hypothetical protein
MWVLVITLFSAVPGDIKSNGSIQVKVGKYEDCMKAKEQVLKTFRVDNFRTNAGCVFIN